MEDNFLIIDDNLLKNDTKKNNLTAKSIEISIKQRSIRKCYTLVHCIPEDIDLNLVVREWKNRFNCSGAVKKDKNSGEEFIELFGDHREEVKEFLIYEGIGSKENISVFGA